MGDSGTLLVGHLIGVLAIVALFKATAMVTMIEPILIFSNLLMDMFYAVLRRYHRGIPLGEPEMEHIHHRLLAMRRWQRYLRYLIRAFARTASNCRDIDELGVKIDGLLARSSITEGTVVLVGEGVERRFCGLGWLPCSR